MPVLALDIGGTPHRWISDNEAVSYHATDSVAWSLGDTVVKYHGGTQKTGINSYIESTSILAIRGHGFNINKHGRVALTNRTLFGRDQYICAYCGRYFENYNQLSRDHIIPRSRGGLDVWENCVSSCKDCNCEKDNLTLAECGFTLLYLPYAPNRYEELILSNRNILADQMNYLRAGVPKHSRLQ